jgi:Uncharacterized NAD(FAD)-dependent dehydrogenases
MKIIIIGGGAGGLSTASNIRKLDKKAKITVITRDENIAYSPCAIPYVLSGRWTSSRISSCTSLKITWKGISRS